MVIIRAILAGILLWSGFAPLEFIIGPFLGAYLLFGALQDRAVLQRLAISALVGFSFFGPLLHWSSSYVGSAPWLILTAGESLIFASIGLIRIERNLNSAIAFASFFTLAEILRMKLPFGGFGWGRLGHTQVDLLSGIYPIIGITGVTFLVALLASIALVSFRRSAILIVLVLLFSLEVTNFESSKPSDNRIGIVAIQGGVDQLGLDFNERAFSVLNRHARLTKSQPEKVELVIWPENAADMDPISNPKAKSIIDATLARAKTNLLLGAVLKGATGPENASILYDPSGEIKSIYRKQDLAPFGEYIPLRSLAEGVSDKASQVRDFQPGSSWQVHEIAGKRFISLICFEILDDDFVRSGMNTVGFVVAQTNNATFGRSAQAAQQLQITRSRAAELGRDIAVVSTTGFTAQINRKGVITRSLKQFAPGALVMELTIYEDRTLASRLGSSFWLALIGIFFLTRRIITR